MASSTPGWRRDDLPAERFSRSLARGLAILEAFSPQRSVLGVAEIAGELGLSRSTAHRYVSTLLALGYLEQEASRKYRLGPRLCELARSARAAAAGGA